MCQWRHWHKNLHPSMILNHEVMNHFASAWPLWRAHESKDSLGDIIASLSIPWGFN